MYQISALAIQKHFADIELVQDIYAAHAQELPVHSSDFHIANRSIVSIYHLLKLVNGQTQILYSDPHLTYFINNSTRKHGMT